MSRFDTGLHYPIKVDKLPVTWVVKYIEDFALEVESGFACGQHNSDGFGVDHLRPMNVSRMGSIELVDVRSVPSSYNDKRLFDGDVLFNNTNSPELIGKTAYVSKKFAGKAFSNHMTRIKFHHEIDPRFAAIQLHYLWMMKYYLHRCVKHVNQASISTKDMSHTIPFVLPPTNEQHRIVAKIEELFSELDKGIESLKTAREQLKVYRQALLKHAFEGKLTEQWRKENADKLESSNDLLARVQQEREARYQQQLGDWKASVKAWDANGKEGKKPSKPKEPKRLTIIKADLPQGWLTLSLDWLLTIEKKSMTTGPFGTALKKAEHQSKGVPVLGIENIGNGKFVHGNKIFVTDEKAEELSPFKVHPGEIVISRSGTVGEICEIPEDVTNALISTNLLRVSLDSKVILSPFFVLMFQGGGVKLQVKDLCKGSSREFLNQSILSSIQYPVCGIEEQKILLELLETAFSNIDQQQKEISESLTKAETLRQSILKKAFSGKLVPQDPNEEPASVLLERIKAEKAEAAARLKLTKVAKKPKTKTTTLKESR